ncbi:MAG: 2-amino-4-hydroxy-6-hydroxymethyldihydropteridine diphosphokinase [Alphaproteobacteria bacterium]|nr:2-amino-4-hydroxy-6-hydroxymethyldihydropteridine diphosphokinase [Alphaproteobacteria bacterium]
MTPAKTSSDGRIFLGIGANLTPDGYSSPQQGCMAAIESLTEEAIEVVAVSPWYKSAPVPVSDQPWFHNAVVEIRTDLAPQEVIAILHLREARFGRVRVERNEARVLDIDIVDFGGRVMDGNLVLPHPRMHLRAFVLRPLKDLAPQWRHPVTGAGIDDLLAEVDPDQDVALA